MVTGGVASLNRPAAMAGKPPAWRGLIFANIAAPRWSNGKDLTADYGDERGQDGDRQSAFPISVDPRNPRLKFVSPVGYESNLPVERTAFAVLFVEDFDVRVFLHDE